MQVPIIPNFPIRSLSLGLRRARAHSRTAARKSSSAKGPKLRPALGDARLQRLINTFRARTRYRAAPAGAAGHATLAAPAPGKAAAAAVQAAAKRGVRRPSSEAPPDSAAPSSEEAPIVPPKLIKSVRAIAPPDALRDFVTGNVTLDAVVDPSGQVKSMKVLSGPASFHTAAMDALKQYRYEPATQRGKPVADHITVTIKFWFEP